MEGLTTYIWRGVLRRHFPGPDRYLSPFISPCSSAALQSKELRDVQPETNREVPLTPQILSNRSADFLFTAEKLRRLGYQTVDLNLGCPSGTVTSRGRGAGFLACPERLETFLDEIFAACPLPISLKTRLGVRQPEEFWPLLALFGRYPASALTVHFRVREEFYGGTPHRELLAEALRQSRLPLCYNGDVFTRADFDALTASHPTLGAVMIGRGAVANPAIFREIRGGPPLSQAELRDFHDDLLESYLALQWGAHNTLHRMKEYWFYMSCLFSDARADRKRIQKARDLPEYLDAVDTLFRERRVLPGRGFSLQPDASGS